MVRDCSSGSSSVMWRASAPSRIRSGADVGTPSRTRGRAVTGPTHMACTFGAQRGEHPVLDAHFPRAHQHRRDRGCRREAHGVELLLGDARHQLVEVTVAGRRMPAVHPDRHHVGARGAQLVEKLGERIPFRGGAVQLDRDALAGDAALDEVVQQLAGRL